MTVFNLLAPIFVIVALGAWLHRIGLLGSELVAGVNRLLYWVGLPAAVFHALATTPSAGENFGPLLAAMMGATTLNALGAWALAPRVGVASPNRGTYVQAAFRGNLSFIALPLLLTIPGVPLGPAMLTFAPMLVLHNAGAVVALVASRPGARGGTWRPALRATVTNPIVVAAIAGAALHAAGWRLGPAPTATLAVLADMALPLALLSIGATMRATPVRGGQTAAVAATVQKTLVSPLIGYVLGRMLGLDDGQMLVLLLCLACPTAAVSYTMVRQLGGDEALAATSVVYSSLASAVVLAVVLAVYAQ